MVKFPRGGLGETCKYTLIELGEELLSNPGR